MNILQLFQDAAAGKPLTPTERAFLKFMQNLGITAFMAALFAGSQYLSSNQAIDLHSLGYVVGSALIFSVLTGGIKYWTAKGDTVSLAVADLLAQLESRVQASLPPLPMPTTPPVSHLMQQSVIQNETPPTGEVPFSEQPSVNTATMNVSPVGSAEPLPYEVAPHFGDTNMSLPAMPKP